MQSNTGVTETGSRRKISRRFWIVGVVVGLSALVIWLNPNCGDGTSAKHRSVCEDNLRRMYSAVVNYVTMHGELPRDANGRFSVEEADSSLRLRCPAKANGRYSFAADVSKEDFTGDEERRIIAWESAWNHSKVGDKKGFGLVLYSDGTVAVSDKVGHEYERWADSQSGILQ
jgi:hypothetical protein